MIPEGIVTSVFPRVERRLESVDYRFDPWQRGFGMAALGCRADGRYAATVGGVTESVPRQAGKTHKMLGLVLGLCAEFAGLRVVWTSHHNRTTTNTFRTAQGIVTRKKFAPLLSPRNPIRVANGEQEIRFANGSLLMFGAREQGFGRGMDAIDILVFDEAQILGLKALEDMVPATNAARHEHGALIFFLGTPPRPNDDGAAFTAKREAAINGKTKDAMYVELSADPGASPDDRSQWPKMNPSFPHRTPVESMLRMRENLPDDDAWRREAMGIWPATAGKPWAVVAEDVWRSVLDTGSDDGWLSGPLSLAIEMATRRDRTSIVLAGERRGGGAGAVVAAVDEGPPSWVVDEVLSIRAAAADRGAPVVRVVIDPRSPAGSLIEDLRAAGVEVTEIPTSELVRATGAMLDRLPEVRVRSTPELDDAVSVAQLRRAGEAHVIDRWSKHDASPFIALDLALWGHAQGEPESEVSVYEERGLVTL